MIRGGKLTGKILMILILSLVVLLVGRPDRALSANLYYGPYLIPANDSATEMFLVAVTDVGVDNDGDHRKLTISYNFDWQDPEIDWTCKKIVKKDGFDRHLFRAKITGLRPSHKYNYTFSYRDWDVSPWSTVSGNFFVQGNTNPDNEVLEFVGLGDLKPVSDDNVYNGGIVALGIDLFDKRKTFMVLTGDMSYLGGDGFENTNTDYWQYFLGNYYWQQILKYLPILMTLGNHDFDTSYGGTDTDNYQMLFGYPNAGGEVEDQYYYYVNGPAVFLSVDTFPIDDYCGDCDNLTPASSQFRWLQQTLSQFDTEPRQWKIAFMHVPMYSPGGCNQKQAREYLQPLFEEHGVDLVLTGHEHYYARKTVPAAPPLARNTDTVHLVLGGAGAGLSDCNNTTGFDKVEKVHHYAWFSIDKDVMEVRVIHPYLDDHGNLVQEYIDHFYIDRTPQANFGYYQWFNPDYRSAREAQATGEKAPPPGSVHIFFQDQSKGHRYQYLWDFGDGTETSTERNPSHFYTKPGIYNVTLTIKGMWNQSTFTGQVAAMRPIHPHLQLLLLDPEDDW